MPAVLAPSHPRQRTWVRWQAHLSCLLLLAMAGLTPAGAAARAAEKTADRPAHSVTAHRDELKDVRKRIDRLGRALSQTERTRTQVNERLRQTEAEISETNQHLDELATQRSTTEAALTKVEQQIRRFETQRTTQQQQLSQLLYQQYIHDHESAGTLRVLLSGNDIEQTTRDRHYQTLLSRAKVELLDKLHQTLAEKQPLVDAARSRQEELADIEKQQQQQRLRLLEQQKQRQTVLASLGDKLKAQQREIEELKRDEQRLSGVIEQLVQTAARAARDRAEKKKARQLARAEKPAGRKTATAPTSTSPPNEPAAPAQRNEHEPEDTGYSGNFSALKGQLRLPVRGELAHRFGTPRAEGGALWKGLFIRASEGSEIKAPAPGRVVFADWLRGFGHLLIIDHGDAWLSVYGNNQSLLRRVGDIVRTGEAIATAGSSGSAAESGLYFELRQQGRAIDPLKWVSLK